MLPGITKNQEEQASQRGAKLPHLTVASGVFHLHQPRVVDRLGEVDFRSSGEERTSPGRRDRTTNCRCSCRHLCRSYENLFALHLRNLQLKKPLQLQLVDDLLPLSALFSSLHHRHQVPNQCARIHIPASILDSYHGTPALPADLYSCPLFS